MTLLGAPRRFPAQYCVLLLSGLIVLKDDTQSPPMGGSHSPLSGC